MRRTIASLLAFALAADAAAEPLFWRSGSLAWSFDDIALQTPTGTRRRSQWSQAYDVSAQGPLVHPLAGELRTNAAFKDGFNVSQAVNTESPAQKSLSWSARGDLFPFALRRYAHFAPNYSWSQTEQAAAADAPSRVSRSGGYGFSGGMSPPGLPSVNFVRQFATRDDPLSSGAVRERAENARESAAWVRGPLRVSLDRDRNEVTDLTGVQGPRRNETRRGDLEVRTGTKKALGLQFFSLRSSAFAQKVQGVTFQEDVTANLAVRSLPLKFRGWANELAYSNDFARNNLSEDQSDSSQLGLLSNSERRWGGLTNSLSAGQSHAGGRSRSLSEAFSVREEFPKRRLSFQQSVNGGWAEGAGGETTRSDGAALRGVLTPRTGRTLTAELETAGSEALGGGGAQRTHRGTLAANGANRRGFQSSARYEHARQSVPGAGLLTVSDALTAALDGPLRPSLAASVQASYSRSRTNLAGPFEVASGSLGLEWEASRAVRASARVSSAGESANVYLGASWTAGRTVLRVYFERREISTPRSFSHLSVSLVRTF
ncbi:hypothetical protein EPO15_00870 [bacterium]|nr:MAG: hypothetical protein EPO15_00870 [bacterium]